MKLKLHKRDPKLPAWTLCGKSVARVILAEDCVVRDASSLCKSCQKRANGGAR